MCRDWTWNVTLASLACGLIIDTLLMVNNYRDRDQDAKSGKKTIVVRWGANAWANNYTYFWDWLPHGFVYCLSRPGTFGLHYYPKFICYLTSWHGKEW